MELLYVVELEARVSDTSGLAQEQIADRVAEHIARWLSHDHNPQLSAIAFESDGAATLASDRDDCADTRLTWAREGTSEVQVLVVTVRTQITRSGRADFVCRITVSIHGGKTIVRIELGREPLDGVLAPTGFDFFRRPHLLVLLLRDHDLQLWSGPNKVDGRFNWVNPKQSEYVWEVLSDSGRRLPVLLVDGRRDAGAQLAFKTAGELAGLAPVLAVDAGSQLILEERLAEIDATVPAGGARLVWPDLSLRHPGFTADQAAYAPGRLLRLLSSVSATVRGVNHLRQRAQGAQREARSREIAEELAEARAQGDLACENEAQARAIERLKDEVNQYADWIQQVEEERDSYKTQASHANYWRQETERLRRDGGIRETDWSESPDLEQADLARLASFLEKRSDGAIFFTPDAHRSWKRSGYPNIEVMQAALVTLTKAAIEHRHVSCNLGMHPDDWFKQEWDMTLASTDKYMSTHQMDKFVFDGKEHSRTPHLKLGDHTSPNEVGRVYFAMDSDGQRFIVDHVGLKLYGL